MTKREGRNMRGDESMIQMVRGQEIMWTSRNDLRARIWPREAITIYTVGRSTVTGNHRLCQLSSRERRIFGQERSPKAGSEERLIPRKDTASRSRRNIHVVNLSYLAKEAVT
nr:hypothetical protein CFP56_43700 [Quercus suber]